MTLAEARSKAGAAAVALDTFELAHGCNAARMSNDLIEQYTDLLKQKLDTAEIVRDMERELDPPNSYPGTNKPKTNKPKCH